MRHAKVNPDQHTAPAPFQVPFPRLYRAHVVAAADSRGLELTAFIEASSHQSAVHKIADAVAAMEGRPAATVADRIYNCYSAAELIDGVLSEDSELRLFETGWGGGRATHFVEQPLFLLAAPAALIRKWSEINMGVRS